MLAKNPSTYHDKIREAQELVREKYTVDAIEKEWVRVVKSFF